MLSQSIYSGISLFMTNLSDSLGVLPFSWDPKRKLFTKCATPRSRCVVNFKLLLIWNTFLLFQILRFQLAQNRNHLNFTVAFTFALATALEAAFIIIYFEDDIILEANSILVYLRRVQALYIIPWKSRRLMKFIEFLLLLQFISLINTFIVECLFFLWLPESPVVPGNIVPPDWHVLVRLPVVYLLPYYVIFVAYMNLFVHFSLGTIYGLVLMPFILRELNFSRRSYKTLSYFRTLPVLIMEYRAAQLLQQRFNQFTGRLLVPTQTLSGGIFVFASFVILRQRQDMEKVTTVLMGLWALISAGMWGLVLRLGGFVFSNGDKVLSSWKYGQLRWMNKNERKFMLKFHKSAKPMTLSYGKMYTIRKLTVLGYFRGLAITLVRVVLTLKTN